MLRKYKFQMIFVTKWRKYMNTFTKSGINALLESVFAPWIQDLGLQVVEINNDNVLFYLPENDNLVRGGGSGPAVVCGQAIASAADTCSVLALTSFNKKFRNCTTIEMTNHFLRPLMNNGIEIKVEALSNGRKMAVIRAEFRNTLGKLAATATCSFAYLE
jgi:uncharacterized protein (TIGR00369 family)